MTKQTQTVRPFLRKRITSRLGAQRWIEALIDNHLDFHLEDSPETIINISTGERTFTDAEVRIVRNRVAKLYTFDWGPHECPIGYMIFMDMWRQFEALDIDKANRAQLIDLLRWNDSGGDYDDLDLRTLRHIMRTERAQRPSAVRPSW